MNKKGVVIIIIILALTGFIFIFYKNSRPNTATDLVLFYSNTCPHCQNVEKFLNDNKILEKIKINQKNIDNNPAATRELAGYAERCGNTKDTVSIPFLWDGSTCLSGDQAIIDYLTAKIK